MEDVLRVYERPLDPARPLVCLDESSRQLVAHSREPLPPRPGDPERWDYEYVRNGVADVFVCFAPLGPGPASTSRRRSGGCRTSCIRRRSA